MQKQQHLLSLFGPDAALQEFDSVQISIASPEQILSWSFGEVKKPETINYRTFRPERDGLFCSRIFGPVKDYECLCGKYKRMKFRGVVCEKCGVEVTQAKVRRERMGHIELASPVAHIWFSKSLPSRVGMLLDLSTKNLDRILYFEGYIVLNAGLTGLVEHQVLSEEEYYRAQQEYGQESFCVGTGAEALKEMLSKLDLVELQEKLRQELGQSISDIRRKKVVKRLKLTEAFLSSGTRPEWMILDVLPVMPPDLRPLVPLDGGRFATADLNDLYRRILNRNNRLKRLIELKAPDMIIRNEKRMLQEIVDAFFDNGRRGRPIVGANKRPLKSLSDMLKGKQGRFRLNLLGKRVDYSGRSVVVVGAELKLHQCGLPKQMALELFKPFVYSRLEQYGLASTIKIAKRLVERERPEIWDILEEVVKERLVLLNRAPTLHRLGFQAFEPVLVEGKAIQLHPLVCSAYNADFDGDQMAVHVPLSLEAQTEARILMFSVNNILSPASGAPVIVPSKDIVLGVYYLTLMREQEKGEGRIFSGLEEVEKALLHKSIALHAKIIARYQTLDEKGNKIFRKAETTAGRMILWNIIPEDFRIKYEDINTLMVGKEVLKLLENVYRYAGQGATVQFADDLVQLGFKYATLSGISYGQDDLIVPKEKQETVEQTHKTVKEYHKQYLEGLITEGERYNKVTDEWTKCTEKVGEYMMTEISKDEPGVPLNSIYMMAYSGARGSPAQMRQMGAMRGLIARHDGTIIEYPIISNFKEGLKSVEYFNSTHGSRKGLSDTAIKTGNAGYLTRRLVDVAQDSVITQRDCGAHKGIMMKAQIEGGEVISSLAEQVCGRVTAEDIINPKTGDLVLEKNHLIDENIVEKLSTTGIEALNVRSVLMCKAKRGLCSLCYGRDLARNRLIATGEAVGIIAAQSIGEPGTQLTLRTFHSGGAAQRTSETSVIEAPIEGSVELRNKNILETESGKSIVMTRYMELVILDTQGRSCAVYKLPYGATLLVEKGEKIEPGQRLVEWDPYTIPIIAECDGIAHYVDLIEGVSLREVVDEETGIAKRVVMEWQQTTLGKGLQPRFVLRDKKGKQLKLPSGMDARYLLSPDTAVFIENKAVIKAGDVLARLSKETFKSRDIVGGLPRIAELFEARIPKEAAILSECDGYVEYGKDYKTKRKIAVVPNDTSRKPYEYLVPKGKQVLIQEGEQIRKGDVLVDGNFSPHDILHILGVEALASFLIKEIQEVYRLQGVKINDKHIEIIVRHMLHKVEIIEVGDTTFLVGDQVSQEDFLEINEQTRKKGGSPAEAISILQGITRASLQTKSFLSAASFQETTRVLIEAAVHGKRDYLVGLKENIIAGRLIPAGTGLVVHDFKEQARKKDAEIYLKHQQKEAEKEAEKEEEKNAEIY